MLAARARAQPPCSRVCCCAAQEPETEAKRLSFAELAACARGWRSRRVLLRAPLAAHASLRLGRSAVAADAYDSDDDAAATLAAALAAVRIRAPSEAEAAALAALPPPAPGVPPAMTRELRALLDWAWFAREVQAPLRLGPLLCATLVAAPPRSLQPARYADHDTLLCQVRGRTRALLIEPGATFPGMYPFPVAHPYDRYACVDVEAPDYGAWPAFAAVRGSVTVLQPGDLLLVPRGWWAHLHALGGGEPKGEASSGECEASDENTCLELRLAPGRQPRGAAATAVAATRRVEELSSGGEGGCGGARALLRRVAAGADLRPFDDLHTPAGYRRLRLATALRDEVALTIGCHPLEVGPFLLAMTDGRMVPTPWLNAAFREPLYLKDVPVHMPDTRTEWERRFPELFTRKLAAEGYATAATPVSLVNPSHPGFIGNRGAAQRQ